MAIKRSRGRPAHPDILTPGEWRVAEGVRHGLSNPEIAARQSISVDAVKFHVSNILGKLGMASRDDLRLWDGIAASSPLRNDGADTESGAQGEIGEIGQIARTVSDVQEATRWYREVLGLCHLFSAGQMAFFDCAGTRLMLSQGEAGPESILYFRVDDIHGALDRLRTRGGTVRSAPHLIHTHEDGSEEWMAFVEDNDGRPLALMATVSSHSKGDPE
ncbi:MAG TPA: LuxR C-terminal-related transcriptional regulator [Hyphomicrobiales bacterium]|nr:LuxR C-terminal-related transcriptional regulator [Hyphomicrobiales bacterium]